MPTNQITFSLGLKNKEVFVLFMEAETLSMFASGSRNFQKQITDCESGIKSTGRPENVKQQIQDQQKIIYVNTYYQI